MPIPSILLTIALFWGIAILAVRRAGGAIPVWALAAPHALVVLAAALALRTAVAFHAVPTITVVALALFILAAGAGWIFFLRLHLQEKSRPRYLCYVNQAVAAISVIMFLVCLFGP